MITFQLLGRLGELGNQLFQIAAVIGLAVKHNVEFTFPEWKCSYTGIQYWRHFPNFTSSNLLALDESYITYEEPTICYKEILYNSTQHLNLKGFFQSENYFSHCKTEITNYFKFDSSSLSNINNIDFSDSVGLQLRFYDYNREQPMKSPVVDANIFCSIDRNIKFIENSMKYFGPNKKYFVSSNNYKKAKQLLQSPNLWFLEEYNALERFIILSKCEHNIITNSTFGWWSAWLNPNVDKVIFAPKNWFLDSHLNKQYIESLYPKSWKIQ